MKTKLFAIALVALALTAPACASTHHKHRHHHAHQPAASPSSIRVWVNTNSGVYHYPGEHWYGRTQEGQYMTEADALKAGYRPTHNGQ